MATATARESCGGRPSAAPSPRRRQAVERRRGRRRPRCARAGAPLRYASRERSSSVYLSWEGWGTACLGTGHADGGACEGMAARGGERGRLRQGEGGSRRIGPCWAMRRASDRLAHGRNAGPGLRFLSVLGGSLRHALDHSLQALWLSSPRASPPKSASPSSFSHPSSSSCSHASATVLHSPPHGPSSVCGSTRSRLSSVSTMSRDLSHAPASVSGLHSDSTIDWM